MTVRYEKLIATLQEAGTKLDTMSDQIKQLTKERDEARADERARIVRLLMKKANNMRRWPDASLSLELFAKGLEQNLLGEAPPAEHVHTWARGEEGACTDCGAPYGTGGFPDRGPHHE